MGVIDSSAPFNFAEPEVNLDISDEKEKASIVRTKKWKEVKKYIDSRKDFYKQYYPGGVPLTSIPKEERDAWWLAATIMSNEFDALINIFEGVSDAIQ